MHEFDVTIISEQGDRQHLRETLYEHIGYRPSFQYIRRGNHGSVYGLGEELGLYTEARREMNWYAPFPKYLPVNVAPEPSADSLVFYFSDFRPMGLAGSTNIARKGVGMIYRVYGSSMSGDGGRSRWTLIETVNNTTQPSGKPKTLHVSCYPNPSSSILSVSWSLAETGHVRISMYDILGGEAALLLDSNADAGHYMRQFPVRQLRDGIYLLRIQSGDRMVSQKVAILH